MERSSAKRDRHREYVRTANLSAPGCASSSRKAAADHRLAAQRAEERRRDGKAPNLFGLPHRGQIQPPRRKEGRVGDAGRLGLAVDVVGNRDARLGQPHEGVRVPDEDQAVGIGIRQGSQERLIQKAENRRVRADTQRNRQY
jgi:hypothetical protein